MTDWFTADYHFFHPAIIKFGVDVNDFYPVNLEQIMDMMNGNTN